VLLVGAPLNGPVLGGIFTVMGFGGFGKSLKNTWPVVLGAVVATLIFGKTLSAPGPILAALFCTTLAPIAGQFGIIAGFIAGFIHLFMVETTAVWHGGLDLYNNGFAGGLTASLIIAIMQWYKTNRPKEDFTI
jgi:fructose-specific phosphotransferase system IIC component